MDNQLTQAITQTQQGKVEIKRQETDIKRWYMYLNIVDWSYPKLVFGGIAVWFFAWTLKLPYPRFS